MPQQSCESFERKVFVRDEDTGGLIHLIEACADELARTAGHAYPIEYIEVTDDAFLQSVNARDIVVAPWKGGFRICLLAAYAHGAQTATQIGDNLTWILPYLPHRGNTENDIANFALGEFEQALAEENLPDQPSSFRERVRSRIRALSPLRFSTVRIVMLALLASLLFVSEQYLGNWTYDFLKSADKFLQLTRPSVSTNARVHHRVAVTHGGLTVSNKKRAIGEHLPSSQKAK